MELKFKTKRINGTHKTWKWLTIFKKHLEKTVIVSFSCHLDMNLDMLGKRKPQLNCLHQICPVGIYVEHNLHYQYRKYQPTVNNSRLGQVGLGCLRKVEEQASKSKPVGRVPSRSLLQSLSRVPVSASLGVL